MINYQIDSLDQAIINALIKNARTPYSQLAKDLRISNSLVHQRIRKLEEQNIIISSRIEIDPYKLGYTACASIGIVMTSSRYVDGILQELEKIPEIVECLNVTGKYGLMIKVYAKDNDHLRHVLYEKIHHIKGISGTNTTMIFRAGFNRQVPIC